MPDLTPEEIADFERRAAAGELPVLEWKVDQMTAYHSYCYVDFILGRRIPVEPFQDTWRIWRDSNPSFESPIAAQLAAEELLRRATAPLHQHTKETQP